MKNRWVTIWMIALPLVVGAGAMILYDRHSIIPSTYWSGWFLLALLMALTALHWRKKLVAFNLGRVRTWVLVHSGLGLGSVGIFFAHTAGRVPTGFLEQALASVFLLTAGSGIVGLFLSQVVPKRLTSRGDEILYARLPEARAVLRERVESLALHALEGQQSAALAQFYIAELADYFRGPRHFFHHLIESRFPLRQMRVQMRAQHQYLADDEREALNQIERLTEQKYDVDYRYALQSVMRWWLFFHIPLTYVLLLLIAAHVFLIFSFS